MMQKSHTLKMSLWVPIAAACIGLSVVAISAGAAVEGIAISISPNYPPNIVVGSTDILVSLSITNNSADDPMNPNVDTMRSVTVDHVFHTPACAETALVCTAPFLELGVFQVVGPATGTGGAVGCAGSWTFSAPDANGEVEFTPPGGAGSLVLGASGTGPPGDRCTVEFMVNALQEPAHDAAPLVAGLQADQLGRVDSHFTDNASIVGGGSGSDSITVTELLAPARDQPAPAMSTSFLLGTGVLLILWGSRRLARPMLRG